MQDEEHRSQEQQFRFVVRTAKEAAQVIKQELGPTARVVAVRQIEATGLARFFRPPKLEVIAVLRKKEDKEIISSPQSPLLISKSAPPPLSKDLPPKEQETHLLAHDPSTKMCNDKSLDAFMPAKQRARVQSCVSSDIFEKKASRISNMLPSTALESVLERMNFSSSFIQRLQNKPEWNQWTALPLSQSLSQLALYLQESYQSIPLRPISSKAAFLGNPGSGKTSSLCKWLAQEVFITQKSVQVFKLEKDIPNSDDALRVFCEVLGISLGKNFTKAHLQPDQQVYFDTSGINLNSVTFCDLKDQLDQLGVTTRILVLNSCYEKELLQQTLDLAKKANITHVIYTHLDEAQQLAKLWPLILQNNVTPLFFSFGQNLTSDFSSQIIPFLLEKTFGSYFHGL